MSIKASKYNFFINADDGYILAYNAFSNSLARVEPEKFELIRQILRAPAEFSFDTAEKKKLKKNLLKGYFLIDDRLDEIEILKMRNRIGRFSGEFLGLTIAPTLACNFKCTYCFEDRKTDTMTTEVEEALIRFVSSRLDSINSLAVTWFGGEPTLSLDIIDRLSNRFRDLCEAHKVEFAPMSMITNGYRLNKEMAEKLKALNIVTSQVTLDGPREVHDRRRKLNNGHGTFDAILANIKEVMDILQIHIRINIDKENVDRVDEIYSVFEEYGFTDKVPFYFGNVQSMTDACSDVSTVCFSTREYSSTVIELLKKSRDKGLVSYRYPSPAHFGFCGADKLNAYVVAPSGYLYKCWNEISFEKEHSVGTVFDEDLQPYQINTLTRYLNWDPFENKRCVKCNFMPICSGGCPYLAFNRSRSKNCIDFKYNLHEMLRLKYDAVKTAQKTKQK